MNISSGTFSSILRWSLIISLIALIIAMILSLPIVGLIDAEEFADMLHQFLDFAGEALVFGRAFVNNFFPPFGRAALSVILYWLLAKPILTFSIRAFAWGFHVLFKG